ncbi:hypothetical protein Tco_1346738 [Tanacetum coccineum]
MFFPAFGFNLDLKGSRCSRFGPANMVWLAGGGSFVSGDLLITLNIHMDLVDDVTPPLALRLHLNTKIKAHPEHIDWGKVIATNKIMDGYVMPKYGNKNLFEDDSWIDIIMDDVYDTFYKDEEEEAKVAKASEDMKLSIMKEKFLAMVESKMARVKDYTKLVVTGGMVDYVLEKYGNKWKSEDDIAYVILEDLWLKYGKDDKGKKKLVEDYRKGKEAEHHHLKVNKDDKGKGKLVEGNGKRNVHDVQNRVGSVKVNLATVIKAKQIDDHDDDDLDTLDLEIRIKNLEEDFGRLLRAKKAKESKKAKEAKKSREAELKAKE